MSEPRIRADFALVNDGAGWMEVPVGPGHPLQHGPLFPRAMFDAKEITDTAKVDDQGRPTRSFRRLLPSLGWTAFMIASAQGRPIEADPQFPFALKAVGYIDPWQVLSHQQGMASTTVEIIP